MWKAALFYVGASLSNRVHVIKYGSQEEVVAGTRRIALNVFRGADCLSTIPKETARQRTIEVNLRIGQYK